jgi:hypothetical protein
MNSNAFQLTPPQSTPRLGVFDALRDLFAATPLAIFANALTATPSRPAAGSRVSRS